MDQNSSEMGSKLDSSSSNALRRDKTIGLKSSRLLGTDHFLTVPLDFE